jgi:membrane protease YdiL (CAAX protease family)
MIPVGPTAPVPRPLIRWGLGDVFIALLIWLVGGIMVSIVLIAFGAVEADTTDLGLGALALSMVAGWPGFLGWPIIATWFKGQRSLALDFGLTIEPIDLAWGLLAGVGALFVSFVGSFVWSLLSGSSTPTNSDFLPTKPSVFTALGVFVLVAICTPIVEELFFRGLFLRALGRKWNLTVGVIVSSLVFGLFHVQGSSFGEAAFIVLVTAGYGTVFALIVVRADGRLGPSIIGHMIVNSVGVLAVFLL